MKNIILKTVSLILTVVMIMSFVSCKETGDNKSSAIKIKDDFKGNFRVGYGRVDVTPEEPCALAGYGNTSNRISDGFLDNLYASCIAISNEKNETIMLVSLDIIRVTDEKCEAFASMIANSTGVKAENVFINASHTHSAPDLISNLGPNKLYNSILSAGINEAAIEAMNDRSKAKMFYGSTLTPALNFVRHYFGDDGTCVGDNHNAVGYNGTIVRHTTESDRTLHVLKFEREGKKDVLLTSYRAHGTMTGGTAKTDVSADWIGAFRKEAESSNDCYLSYFQGAAGNQNPTSRITSEVLTKDYNQYGKLLNESLSNVLPNMVSINGSDIKVTSTTVPLDINHTEDSKAGYASMISAYWSTKYDSVGCAEMGKPYGIYSQYHANGILSKAKLGKTKKVKLGAFSIGDIAFSCASYEQFDTNGCQVIDASPFKHTVAVGYTNGFNSYIPSAYAYEYGCYEVDIGTFASGSGEKASEHLIALLKELHK